MWSDGILYLSTRGNYRRHQWHGDSGGPLVRKPKGKAPIVIGVISNGIQEDRTVNVERHAQSVDLRGEHKAWIEEQIKQKDRPSLSTTFVDTSSIEFVELESGCRYEEGRCFESTPFDIPEGARQLSAYHELYSSTINEVSAEARLLHDDFGSKPFEDPETRVYSGDGLVVSPRAGKWGFRIDCRTKDDCLNIDFAGGFLEVAYDTVTTTSLP